MQFQLLLQTGSTVCVFKKGKKKRKKKKRRKTVTSETKRIPLYTAEEVKQRN